MKIVSASVTLNCSAQQVFDFINDQRNHARLNPHNFQDYRVVSPQSVGVGARSQVVLKTGAFREEVILEVTGSEPPRLLIEEGHFKEGQFRVSWQLTPLGPAQTSLEIQTEYHTTSLLAPLLTDQINRAFVRIYKRLLTDLAAQLNSN